MTCEPLPRRRASDRFWTRCRTPLSIVIVGLGFSLALLAFQDQSARGCRSGNQVRLVIRTILQQSYADALQSGRLDPANRVRVKAQLARYLELAKDRDCPGVLP